MIQQPKTNEVEQENTKKEILWKKRIIKGGVQIVDESLGHGTPVQHDQVVAIYYSGKIEKDGQTKSIGTHYNGDGFTFQLGKGHVIKGLDIGIVGMKVGGMRQLTIPPKLGYI